MKVNDKLVWEIQLEDVGEMKRLYEQLICVPGKHRKKEITQLIDELHSMIENVGGFEEN